MNAAELELIAHSFSSLALEMGEMLRRTAVSTNVKEREDFSCALLDPEGRLVANAPHIPVHLGALGVCVREVRQAVEMGPGDAVLTNHPAFGGSHLPDLTLISPVYSEDGDSLLGYVANRAHHAEIGGKAPGSMAATAQNLAEEGIVFEPLHLMRADEPQWAAITERFGSGPFPSRAGEENLVDLRAQLAANLHGAEALRRLAGAKTPEVLFAAMDDLHARANRLLQRVLVERVGSFQGADLLDDGTPLNVAINIHKSGEVEIDFAGSGAQHAGNLNANRAIVTSAVIYTLRLMVAADLPLNDGLLESVKIKIPNGSFLAPKFFAPNNLAGKSEKNITDLIPAEKAPAVGGGNVETSQRVVDLLVRTLGLMAGSQATMNNVIFGNPNFGFYETLGGGSGAGPGTDRTGFAGASAVHVHMTNTRVTDPEVIERRYPVRLERFEIRNGSGGTGRAHGGGGLIREYRFLEQVELSLLTQRRTDGPPGLDGGEAGAPGRQTIIRTDGTEERLSSTASTTLHPGDLLRIETPGGGGWGDEKERMKAEA